MTIPLVYAEEQLTAGAVLRLEGAAYHYLGRVMRVKSGDVVRVSDGRGVVVCGEVGRVGSDWLELRLGQPECVDSCVVPVSMVLSPLKGKGHYNGLRACGELGVERVVVVPMERSIARVQPAKLAHLQESVREAARRVGQPRVAQVSLCDSLAAAVGRQVGDRLYFFHEKGGQGVGTIEPPEAGGVCFVVGPEGGLSPGEATLLQGAGVSPIRLAGPAYTAETALVLAVTLIMHRMGRL